MTRVWVTNGSTTVEGVVNPVAAACEEGFVPDTVRLLTNPGLEDVTPRITDLLETIVTAYGDEEPTIEVRSIASETNFEAIVAHFRDGIAYARDRDGSVAVDVTPGRKYMSAIALQVGLREGADHVYYLHVPGAYFSRLYSTIPRTALELYDFTEVF